MKATHPQRTWNKDHQPEGIEIPQKPEPPPASWWVGVDREAWHNTVEGQRDRLSRSREVEKRVPVKPLASWPGQR